MTSALHRRGLILSGAALAAAPAVLAAGLVDDDAVEARRWARERRWAGTGFGRIAYVDRGRGPAALFLHGFPLSGFQWRGVMARVSHARRCIAPDFMGLGRTDPAPGQSLAPAAQAEMLAALLDRLGVGEVDLVANDSGGAVAQLFIARWPGRVRTLLLTNCDTEADSPPPALRPVIEMARAGVYPDRWLAPWLRDKRLARSEKGLGGMCYSLPGRPSDAALDEYLGPPVASPRRKALVDGYALGLEANALQGVGPRLRTWTGPARIVWGMADTIFSPRSPDDLAAILPGATGVRRLARAKLFFPEEYPDILADEALRLWNLRAG